MKRIVAILMISVITVFSTTAFAGVPQLMNYQGRLLDSGGDPLDTTVSMTFTIYDDSTGGNVKWTETQSSIVVTDGLFDVLLGSATSFSDTSFSDPDRWLGIEVGSDPEISPRTRLTSYAYAFRAEEAASVEDGSIVLDDIAQNGAATGQVIKWDGSQWTVDDDDTGSGGSGDITAVFADNGLTGGSTTGDAHLNVGSGDGIQVSADLVSVFVDDFAGDGLTTTGNDLEVNTGMGLQITTDAVELTSPYSTGSAYDARFVNEGQTDAITTSMILDGTIMFQDIGPNGAVPGQVMKWMGGSWMARNDETSPYWIVQPDSVLYTQNYWGLARGGAGNILNGPFAYTMVNWGVNSVTGSAAATSQFSTVSGGDQNTAGNDYATVGGGFTNQASGNSATVSGGNMNNILSGADYGFIGGGVENTIESLFGTISGGNFNQLTPGADYGAVGGGQNNVVAEHPYSCVLGGQENNIIGVLGQHNAIGGGWRNVIDHGRWCAIPGGSDNNVMPGPGPTTDYSMLFGQMVNCNMPYEVIFYDAVNFGAFMLNRDDFDGPQLGAITVGTNPANGNGAFLSWGGVWTSTSSRDKKENFEEMNGAEVLRALESLPIESWTYKGSTERHIWPCAEDFVKVFDVGITDAATGMRNDKHLAAGDMAGVALAGVKELARENRELKQLVEELMQRVEELESASQ